MCLPPERCTPVHSHRRFPHEWAADDDGDVITDDEDSVSEADDEDACGDEDKDDVQVRPGGLPGDPRPPAALDHPPPLHHLHPPLRTPS